MEKKDYIIQNFLLLGRFTQWAEIKLPNKEEQWEILSTIESVWRGFRY